MKKSSGLPVLAPLLGVGLRLRRSAYPGGYLAA